MGKDSRMKAERREARLEAQKQALLTHHDNGGFSDPDARARIITRVILAVLVAGVIGLIIWIHSMGNDRPVRDTFPEVDASIAVNDVSVRPNNVNADGGIVLGENGSATGVMNDEVPTISIALDYSCNFCAALELLHADSFFDIANAGTANLVFHPVSIMDHATGGTMFSSRAAAATYWVASQAPEYFLDFHVNIFTNIPEEGLGFGLTNITLADIARAVGVPEDVAMGIQDGTAMHTYGQWVASLSNYIATVDDAWQIQHTDGGSFFGTPAIQVNGVITNVEWPTPGAFETLIELLTNDSVFDDAFGTIWEDYSPIEDTYETE